MLLRNESRIVHAIKIKLVFDDGRKRELEIHEYDSVQVSYRKNGCIRQGVGVIRNIKPYVHSHKFPFCKRASAIITLDMSEDLVSCVDKFDMFDIIDIRKVQNTDTKYGCHCGCNNTEEVEPDFEITRPECPEDCPADCPATDKDVVES